MKPQKPSVKKIDPLKLKTSRKVGNNARIIDNVCPYCLSKIITEKGKLKCTAERLIMWTKEFKLFSTLSEQQQFDYLKASVSNPDKFIDLYYKWENNELDCVYNSKFTNFNSSKEEIPDPLIVSKIEKSLKRILSEEEKKGELAIWTNGIEYFDKYEKGLKLFKIPTIIFPDDI